MTAVAFVALAALGASARWGLSHLNRERGMPFGTLVPNLAGSFALGLLVGAGQTAMVVAGTGALGAFTTFSAFSGELAQLRRAPGVLVAYLCASVGGGVGLAWLAIQL